MSEKSRTEDEIEDATRAALAGDIWNQYDEDVTVVDYYSIVQVMDKETGRVSLRTVFSGHPNNVTMLGWTEWAGQSLRFAMDRQFAYEYDGE